MWTRGPAIPWSTSRPNSISLSISLSPRRSACLFREPPGFGQIVLCRPDAWVRVSFAHTRVSIVGWIYDPDPSLPPRMYVAGPTKMGGLEGAKSRRRRTISSEPFFEKGPASEGRRVTKWSHYLYLGAGAGGEAAAVRKRRRSLCLRGR